MNILLQLSNSNYFIIYCKKNEKINYYNNLNPNYFCQFFTIYCNKIHEIIVYYYKVCEVINCLLQ